MAASVIAFRVGKVSILSPRASLSKLANSARFVLSLRRSFVVTQALRLKAFRVDRCSHRTRPVDPVQCGL